MSKTKYIAKCKTMIGNRYCWNINLNHLLKTMREQGYDINDFNFYIETDAGEIELKLPDKLKNSYAMYEDLQNRLYDVYVEKAKLEHRIEEAIKILEGASND